MSGVDVLAVIEADAHDAHACRVCHDGVDPKDEATALAESKAARDAVADLIEKGDALMRAFRSLDKVDGVAAALAFDRALTAAKGGRQ